MTDTHVIEATFQFYGLFVSLRTARGYRFYNRYVKEALEETLIKHHLEHMPRHFDRNQQKRYGYKPRSRKYNIWKGRVLYVNPRSPGYGKVSNVGAVADLVKSGALKKIITRFLQIRKRGTMAKTGADASLVYPVPFNVLRGDLPNTNVKKNDILDEVARMTPQEAADLAAFWELRFLEKAMRYEQGTIEIAGKKARGIY